MQSIKSIGNAFTDSQIFRNLTSSLNGVGLSIGYVSKKVFHLCASTIQTYVRPVHTLMTLSSREFKDITNIFIVENIANSVGCLFYFLVFKGGCKLYEFSTGRVPFAEYPVSTCAGILSVLLLGASNIRWVFRLAFEIPNKRLFDEMARDSEKHKRETGLILTSRYDNSGAFLGVPPGVFRSFERFAATHAVIERRVSSIEDINTAITDTRLGGRKIVLLYVQAHGSPDGVWLGDKPTRKHEVGGIDFSKLEKRALIILYSCNTGVFSKMSFNVAEKVQLAAGPDYRVIAPQGAPIDAEFDLTTAKFGMYRDEVLQETHADRMLNIATLTSYKACKEKQQKILKAKMRKTRYSRRQVHLT